MTTRAKRSVHRDGKRLATRVAFAVIIAFVLAQVAWWLVLMFQLVDDAADFRTQAWLRDASTVQALLNAEVMDAETLLARYPHLRIDGGLVDIDPAAHAAAEASGRSTRRMILFEGPFFAVVILSMLGLIALSLRAERELKRRQQNFLSAVTHELNTPIGTLRLLVQTLRLRAANPERTIDYLRRMEGELDRLERTTGQVLAAARLEQASAPTVLSTVDVGVAVQGVLGRARSGLEARGARLQGHYHDEALLVSLDVTAFALVLENLLDNAVKYSPPGGAIIDVTVTRDGAVARIHVDDRGVGIPEAERGRIFERFYRAGDELTRVTQGVGLGLHLVKSVTEAMNGWVSVSDGPSRRGTRFTLTFPLRVQAMDAGSDEARMATA